MRPRIIAREMLALYWDRTIPVDVAGIASKMGARVEADIGLALDQPDLSGCVSYEGKQAVIRYNPTDIPVRQRFTIAHEIGHLALHAFAEGKKFRDTSKTYSLSNFDAEEAEANRFAAELLMPEEAVKQVILDNKDQDPKSLAKVFAVSEVAMRYRLKNLGWLK
jgi:Zn-dependent peptidase ImmA (M78 family)